MGGIASENACKAMKSASAGAIKFNHDYVSTEHLLLGVVNNPDNGASEVLKALNVDAGAIRLDVEKLIPV